MNIEQLREWPFREIIQSYSVRDALLYALSTGYGADPADAEELRYVYEKQLTVAPTMAVVLGHPGPWYSEAGIDVRKIVYAEQRMKLHSPLKPSATVAARERVVGFIDKGREKGALLYTERQIVDRDSGVPLATLNATLMCRGDGGGGSSFGEAKLIQSLPETSPDRTAEMPTLPQSALFYRLNGDMNPLHADPDLARQLGFERPILHGLCSYAVAARAILRLWCGYEAAQLKSFGARFSAPIYPGETLVVETWRNAEAIVFRAWCKERRVKVLDNGIAVLGQ